MLRLLLHLQELGQANWRTWKNPRMKWAKHFYNLIKHWFSFSHFTDIFTDANEDSENDDFEYVQSCQRKWSSMRFVLLSKRGSIPRLLLVSSLLRSSCLSLVSFRFCFAVSLVVVSCQLGEHYVYIYTIPYYIVYKYVCTLCYLLCRQDVAGRGEGGKRETYFAKLPIVGFIFRNGLAKVSVVALI